MSKPARLLSGVNSVLENRASFIFLAWAIWLSLEYLALGRFSYVRIPDNADINLPARLAFAREFSTHALGLWAPKWASGVDRLSQIMGSGLDALPYIFLPGWLSYGLFMLTQRFIASYFSFRLMRDQFSSAYLPALYVGLTYSLFSHDVFGGVSDGFTLYDGLALPGLPLLLWWLGRLEEHNLLRGVLSAAGMGTALAFTSGFPIAVFTLPVFIFWFALVSHRRTIQFWVFIGCFFAAWLVGSTPYLWATLLNGGMSHRSDWDVSSLNGSFISQVWLLIKLARDNSLPLTLGVSGLLLTRGKEPRLRALFAMMVACLFFGPVYMLLVGSIRSYLGFLSGFTFDRFFLLIPFLAAVMAGLAFDYIGRGWGLSIREDRADPKFANIELVSAIAVAAICLVVWQSIMVKLENLWEMKGGSNFAAIFERPDLVELRTSTRDDPPFRVATTGDHAAYAWAYGFETADGYLVLYPKRYQEFWGEVIAPVLRKNTWLYNYYHGYGNLIYLLLPEFRPSPTRGLPAQSPIRFDENYTVNLLSLANVRFVFSPTELEATHLKLLPSRFRALQSSTFGSSRFQAYADMLRGQPPGPPIFVYENPQALPRFFLAGNVKILPGPKQVLEQLRSSDIDALHSTALVEVNDVVHLDLGGVTSGTGSVTLQEYGADTIVLTADADSSRILIVTNNYSRYWTAQINGVATKIFPVDHTFQGILLPSGHNQVRLRYSPPYALRMGNNK